MGARSSVYSLPEAVRAELDRRLRASGFGDYSGHEAWVAAQGFVVSRAAIHRYAAKLRAASAPCEGLCLAAERAEAAGVLWDMSEAQREALHNAIMGR